MLFASDKKYFAVLYQICCQVAIMNFLLQKKDKPQFSLKSIENSNLFQRRVANCHNDNHEFSRQMLIKLNHVAADDKNDKFTNTTSGKSADNSPSNGTRFQTFGGVGGNMESQLGKSVTIEVNRGFVLIRTHVVDGAISSKFNFTADV